MIEYILLFLLVFFGILSIIAKNLWRDRTKTQIFVFVAVVCTICFMIVVYPKLP